MLSFLKNYDLALEYSQPTKVLCPYVKPLSGKVKGALAIPDKIIILGCYEDQVLALVREILEKSILDDREFLEGSSRKIGRKFFIENIKKTNEMLMALTIESAEAILKQIEQNTNHPITHI